ncbi:hypothetical protein V8C42DRAFT_244053 [Trichoderma barbatum]
MMGPDGLVQRVTRNQIDMPPRSRPEMQLPDHLGRTDAGSDAYDSTTHLSPQPSGRRSSSVAPHDSDVEYSHAPSPLMSFSAPGGGDETMTDAGPDSDSSDSDLDDANDAGNLGAAKDMEVEYASTEDADVDDDDDAEDMDVAEDADADDTDGAERMDDAEVNSSTHEKSVAGTTGAESPTHDRTAATSERQPCDVVDLTTDDGHSDDDANQQQGGGTGATLQMLYQINALPPDELDGICAFFRTTPAEIESGFVIPGTIQALTTPQLAFVFQFVKKSLGSGIQPQGQILADATGMGKTHCGMALIAVIRLLLLSEKHVTDHPSLATINR